jgi:hypothetical protein
VGQQWGTFYLQLPYRYVVPILATISISHWLMSQSLFLARVEIYDQLIPYGLPQARQISACGRSREALVLDLAVGGIMVVALLASGFRRFEKGIPVASSCNLAISTACHPPAEGRDTALLPMQYGAPLCH